MRSFLPLVVIALIPSRVLANHVSIGSGTVTGSLSSSSSQLSFNRTTCLDTSKTVVFTFPVTFSSGVTVATDAKYAIRGVVSSSTSCTIAAADTCYAVLASTTFTTAVTSIVSSSVTLQTLSNNNCALAGSNSISVQALIEDPNGGVVSGTTTTTHGTTTNPVRGTVALTLDNEAPSATTATGTSDGDARTTVSWTTSSASDLGSYDVYYSYVATALTGGAAIPTCTGDPTTGVACSTGISSSATSLQISGLTNGQTVYLAVAVADKAGNKSVLSNVVTGTPQPVDDFFTYYVKQGGNERGGFCFIATAAFGDYDDPQVRVLRRFRDEVLMKIPGGAALVRFYYWLSPDFADEIRHNDGARALVRLALWPVVAIAWVATSVPPPLLLALLAAFLMRRKVAQAIKSRVRAVAGASLVVATLFGTGAANAAADESPRNFMLELRFGPYKPEIDSEAAFTSPPYATVLGNKTGFMFQMEIDYQFFQKFGSLGVGGTIGYWQMLGKGVFSSTGSQSADSTTLSVLPLQLSLVYRFDYLAEKYKFPIVPYAKGGLSYFIFWVNNGARETVSAVDGAGRTHKSYGGVFGLHGNVGLALSLDSLDPDATRTFDLEVGVNHTYLFAEVAFYWANDFGNKGLNLSTVTFFGGIAFEF